MTKEAKKYDLDLAQMADEALVILVQECTFKPAADELVLRYYERMNQLIAVRLRQRWFTADVQDAQQNGVFAILEAIAGYDTREVAKPRGCSFCTFVRLVVRARCCDFVKQVRRAEKRCRRLDERRAERGSDPVEVLAQQEEMARLPGLFPIGIWVRLPTVVLGLTATLSYPASHKKRPWPACTAPWSAYTNRCGGSGTS
jgi:hypothetical protein